MVRARSTDTAPFPSLPGQGHASVLEEEEDRYIQDTSVAEEKQCIKITRFSPVSCLTSLIKKTFDHSFNSR